MYTKLFHRLSYLLCLFQISCFVALQCIPLHSSSFSDCSDEHKKIDVVCHIHSEELQIEPKNFGNELLVCGFIREFEPKVANKIIPDCIMNLCVGFSRRMLPCDCIKEKYRKILLKLRTLHIDEYRKKALIFFLMYKIEDVQDEKGKSKKTILHYACGNGHLGLAKLLRQQGANIYAKDKNSDNALHLACWSSGSVEMVTWLLDVCKIDIEAKGWKQTTPFLCAAYQGQLGIAKLLKEEGANIHAKNAFGNNALYLACLWSGSVPMVTWLLDECKLGLEKKGYEQKTPFLCAAYQGQLAIAKLLRQRGANIYATDKDGDNALHFACLYSGSIEMINWLLDECKIDIETKGEYKRTPFLCAAKEGQLAIAKRLKERGASTKATDEYGCNALRLAKENNRQEMIRYLKSQSRIKTGRCLNFLPKWF